MAAATSPPALSRKKCAASSLAPVTPMNWLTAASPIFPALLSGGCACLPHKLAQLCVPLPLHFPFFAGLMCGFQPGFWTLEELMIMQCHGMAAMQELSSYICSASSRHATLFLIRSMTSTYSASEHMSTSCFGHNLRSMLCKCSTCEDHDASRLTTENLGEARAQAARSTRYGPPSAPLMHRIMKSDDMRTPLERRPRRPSSGSLVGQPGRLCCSPARQRRPALGQQGQRLRCSLSRPLRRPRRRPGAPRPGPPRRRGWPPRARPPGPPPSAP